MLFFTADTHFNDPRILRIDRWLFADLAAHDEALVANWNAAVTGQDEVWHLGDFARETTEQKAVLLSRLNGTKHLVTGNNDDEATRRASGWRSVQAYAELTVDDRLVILCHYAFRTWNGMNKGAINLHGHSHAKLKPMTRQYDVGVDAFSCRPVTLTQVLASRTRGQPRAP